MPYTIPLPWKSLTSWVVGGLFQVGYAEGSDLLLVLSSQGRGVFNCLTGEKLARDPTEAHDFFDSDRLEAQGLGPLEGKTIRMAGLFGGEMLLTTEDGWTLTDKEHYPSSSILLTPPAVQCEDGSLKSGEPVVIGEDGPCELRTYGFSETGRSFVIATSCEVVLFVRERPSISAV